MVKLRVGMQNRYIDRYQRPPEDSLVRQSSFLPWCIRPVMGPMIRLSEEPQEEKNLKGREKVKVCGSRGGRAAVWTIV